MNAGLLGNRVFADITKRRPKPMTGVLIRKKKSGHRENACDNRGRDYSYVARGQGTSRITGNH